MTQRPLSAALVRLVWLSLLPLLLVAGSLAVYHVYSENAAMRAAAARRLVNYAAQIDTFLEARILALNMLARSPLADDPKRWAELYAEAQAFQASFGSHVIFADAGRQMLFNTRVPFGTTLPKLPDARQGRSAAPIALETGKPAVGDIVQGPVINEALFAIVVPGLRDAQVRHLMLVTTTTRELQRRVDAIHITPGWAFSVRDGAAELVARQAPAGFDPARDVDDDWRFKVKSRHAPWTFAVEVPQARVRAPLRDTLAVLLLAIVLATLAGRIMGRRVAGRIVRQVAALAEPGSAAPPADITEIAAVRARLDANFAALRERDHKLSAIIGFSPSALSLKTPDGRYALANPNLQRIHHCSEEQIIGKTDFDLYPEETARALRANDQRVLNSGAKHSIEEIVPVDGEPRSYMSHVFPVRDEHGMIEYICRISLDSTERKAVERALAEAQAAALTEQQNARAAALNLMEDAIAARKQAEAMAATLAGQVDELRRWQQAMLGREDRIISVKQEVNELLAQLDQPPRYTSPDKEGGAP